MRLKYKAVFVIHARPERFSRTPLRDAELRALPREERAVAGQAWPAPYSTKYIEYIACSNYVVSSIVNSIYFVVYSIACYSQARKQEVWAVLSHAPT